MRSLLTAFALTLAALTALAAPAPLPTVPSVDLARYAGAWYEIALLPNRFQKQCVADTQARYQLDGDRLSFAPLMSTRMACRPDIMKAEQAFFDMLGKVKAMKLGTDRLELLDAGGRVLATFDRRVAE